MFGKLILCNNLHMAYNDWKKLAEEFAKEKHGSQVRKYTGEPYWTHLKEVADLVYTYTEDENQDDTHGIVVAWLHDTIEDTSATYEEIESIFGKDIADDVLALSDLQTPADGNRKVRKERYKNQIAKANKIVQTVKLADLISNTHSIVEHDSDFARIYLKEKQDLLQVLTKGNYILRLVASETLKRGIAQLQNGR